MRKLAGILLAAALMAPMALSAQQQPGMGQGRGMGRGMMGMNAISIAVAHKADLGLNDEVAAKLDAMAKELQEKNAPIMKQMTDARAGVDFQSMTDEQRQAMREKTMPLMQKLRDNNQAARTDAEKLLTPDQVKKLADIIQQEMPQRGPRPNN